jgi:hypothetical protein
MPEPSRDRLGTENRLVDEGVSIAEIAETVALNRPSDVWNLTFGFGQRRGYEDRDVTWRRLSRFASVNS